MLLVSAAFTLSFYPLAQAPKKVPGTQYIVQMFVQLIIRSFLKF